MDTKTDTKPSLRIWGTDDAFGVHLGVHFSLRVQPQYSTERVRRNLEAVNVGHAAVYQLTEPRGPLTLAPSPP
jgi:hypothetical protein